MAKTPARKLASMKRYRDKRKLEPGWIEKRNAYHKAYYEANRERLKEQQRQYNRAHALRALFRKKGLRVEDHIEYLRQHHGVCDLCGERPDGQWNTLAIDHCHKTKTFRGLLCSKCNRGLGFFRDRPQLLRKAAEYLERQR